MPGIYRQGRMKQNRIDGPRRGMPLGQFKEFSLQRFRFSAGLELYAQHADGLSVPLHARQTAAPHAWMGVEYALASRGQQQASPRFHAMVFPSTEPQPSFFVHVSEITHTMEEGTVLRVGDLRHARGVRAIQIGGRDGYAPNAYLPCLATTDLEVVCPLRDRGIRDRGNSHIHARDRAAKAYPSARFGALRGGKNFAALNRRYRCGLG